MVNPSSSGARSPSAARIARLVFRVALVAVQLVLVFYLGQTKALFFYQNF